LYIYPRRNQWRIPILIGCAAFTCTLGILLSVVLVRQPDQLLAALNLALAKTSTPTASPDPTVEVTFTPEPTATGTEQPSATSTPRPTKTPSPSPTLMPTNTPINVLEHFILGRPVPANASGIVPDWTYLYGSTQHGNLEVHHGEEFVNPIGTPLLAVADGLVVVAGDDSQPHCGAGGDQVCGAETNFYGNLVIIQLDQLYEGQALFVLCGHMDTIGVKFGQHVNAGDPIGTVGDTGIALGPHCHVEVRLGVNDYAHTRNPILWMKPLPGTGALAGMVQDRNGNPLRGVNVFVYQDNATQDYLQDTETYGRDEKPPVNSDDGLRENWAMGDLRAGKYLLRVQLGGLNYVKHVTIEDGKLLFVVFGGE
jgi:murein DD-endopeptidase MepM/ murein hydrolase activator NlpD